jgi:hypothetical protein
MVTSGLRIGSTGTRRYSATSSIVISRSIVAPECPCLGSSRCQEPTVPRRNPLCGKRIRAAVDARRSMRTAAFRQCPRVSVRSGNWREQDRPKSQGLRRDCSFKIDETRWTLTDL